VPRRLARPAPPLSDGVVWLEPLAERFAGDFEALAKDPAVLRFTRVPSRRANGFVAGWIAGYERGWTDGTRAGFAIVGADDGEFLGMVGLIRIQWEVLEAEIGYVVAPAARGRGVAGRAIDLVSRWALADLGLARIEAWIDVDNQASQRAAERAGYTREGVRRSSQFKDGKRADMAIYSLLPGELR
jgi:RimJ/RimL family protein N-acetyltransferase